MSGGNFLRLSTKMPEKSYPKLPQNFPKNLERLFFSTSSTVKPKIFIKAEDGRALLEPSGQSTCTPTPFNLDLRKHWAAATS
jgi:hypothetical protein